MFRFYNGSDGPPRYSVLNFQKMDDDSYAWKGIGTFSRNCLLSLKPSVKWMEFRPVAQDVAPKSFNWEAIFGRFRCLSADVR
jgi:hypothetical protein